MKIKKENFIKMNHELRTPIVSMIDIINEVELDSENHELNEKFQKLFEISNYLLDTINTVLDSSKACHVLAVEKFIVSNLIEELKTLLQPLAISKNQTLNFDFPTRENIIIKSNYNIIKMICVNLISNAIKYSKDGSKINVVFSIQFVNRNKYFNIEVEDNGNGIEQNKMKRLFNSKFMTPSNKNSSGLGLYITNSLIKKLKAKLYYESELGIGSYFRVSVPVKHVRKIEAADFSDKKILIIDDDFCLCAIYKNIIKNFGVNVDIINEINGEIKFENYDLIVIDYHIENLNLFDCSNGNKLAKYIYKNYNIKSMLISSNKQREIFHFKLPSHIKSFVPKPVSSVTIKQKIIELLID